MRKIVLLEHVSLDGYLSGPGGDMSFIRVDEELEALVRPLTAEAGGVLWGRVTYQMMAGFWPTVLQAPEKWGAYHREHAAWLETADKFVFSRTLTDRAPWADVRWQTAIDPARIAELKRAPGGDLLLIGSASLAHAFIGLGLIDEWRIQINPVAIGAGTRLFPDGFDRQELELCSSQSLASGVVALHLRTRR